MDPVTGAAPLACRGLAVRVPGRELLRGLDLALAPGRLVALLGRNGAGKSTLLHVLAGLRPAEAGEVMVQGRPLAAWPRRDLARQLALLLEHGKALCSAST